ncbi:ACT domain-containing protein [Psychroserpens sp. SPM9]|uniref:ACT domain-containing protein n=1 Tax=Psychroserpens sp. SPM9 TaxID=2975598 RepID=UPI0021A3E8AC|nr:ACT domain-containing protein [Psychroserpens sp. SPM9]MDG5493009.1 ACT domain-containing protein [Psychroserpens sp. SPM9]
MSGEKNIAELIKNMKPIHQQGDFVFCTVKDLSKIDRNETICEFKETEGTTIIIEKSKADTLQLDYHYVATWITLSIHSSLEAVGLTAVFSSVLAKHNISCNVIAGYYHDHIFVDKKDAIRAIEVLNAASKEYHKTPKF